MFRHDVLAQVCWLTLCGVIKAKEESLKKNCSFSFVKVLTCALVCNIILRKNVQSVGGFLGMQLLQICLVSQVGLSSECFK